MNARESPDSRESIRPLASADIRAQLPDDTKRFEGIDSEFKDLMKEAVTVPSVIPCCLEEGREQLLKDMTKRLRKIEKVRYFFR